MEKKTKKTSKSERTDRALYSHMKTPEKKCIVSVFVIDSMSIYPQMCRQICRDLQEIFFARVLTGRDSPTPTQHACMNVPHCSSARVVPFRRRVHTLPLTSYVFFYYPHNFRAVCSPRSRVIPHVPRGTTFTREVLSETTAFRVGREVLTEYRYTSLRSLFFLSPGEE